MTSTSLSLFATFTIVKDELNTDTEQSKFVDESLDNDASEGDLETSVDKIQQAKVKSADINEEELLLNLLLSFDEANKNGDANDKAGNILHLTDTDIDAFVASLGLTDKDTIEDLKADLKALVQQLQEKELDKIDTTDGTTSDQEQVIIDDIKAFNKIKGSAFGITDAHIEAYAKEIGIDDAEEIKALKELVDERKNERFGNLLASTTDTYIDEKDTETTTEEKRLINDIKVFSGLDADTSVLNLTDKQVKEYAKDLELDKKETKALSDIVNTYKNDIKDDTKDILNKEVEKMTDAEKENVIAHLISTQANGENVFYLEEKNIEEFVRKELKLKDDTQDMNDSHDQAVEKLKTLVEERKQEKRDEVAELLDIINDKNPNDTASKAADARLEELIKDDIRINGTEPKGDITTKQVDAFVEQWGLNDIPGKEEGETNDLTDPIKKALGIEIETKTKTETPDREG